VRDLKKDLEICKDAARGPWNLNEDLVVSDASNLAVVECDSTLDTIFISESREGWPHAINRAIAAEAEVERLHKALSLAHSMILCGEQHSEQSRQVIEGALGLR